MGIPRLKIKDTGSAPRISTGYLTLQQLLPWLQQNWQAFAAAFALVTTKQAGLVSAQLNSLPSLKLKSK